MARAETHWRSKSSDRGSDSVLQLTRASRLLWPLIIFFAGFVALLLLVLRFYLIPGMEVMAEADPEQRARLAAWSRLLLTILLVMLVVGLLLIFRVRRWFTRS